MRWVSLSEGSGVECAHPIDRIVSDGYRHITLVLLVSPGSPLKIWPNVAIFTNNLFVFVSEDCIVTSVTGCHLV